MTCTNIDAARVTYAKIMQIFWKMFCMRNATWLARVKLHFPPLFAFAMRPLINAIFNFGEVRIKYANFPISANVIRSRYECVYVWCVCLSVPLSLCCLLVCLFFFVACACLFPNFATTNDKNCTWVMVYQWKYAQKPLRQMQSEKESWMLASLWSKRSCLG